MKMPNALLNVDQLRPLVNIKDKKPILEIILRDENQRFKEIVEFTFNDKTSEEKKNLAEVLRRITHQSDKELDLCDKNLQDLFDLKNIQSISTVMGAANLCATVVGFAVMYKKLDNMTDKLTQQIEKVQEQLKKGQDINVKSEFRKAISDHADMLDCQKKQRPYSEEKLRELVDREYNVLVLLIDVLKQDLVSDRETMLVSVFSLLSMLTVSLQRFDETYYYANREVLADKNVWHTAHDKWMGVYDTLSEQWFTEMLQDYGIFDAKLTTQQTDAYYTDLLEQIRSQRQAVEGNQELILQLESEEDLRAVREYIERAVQKEVDAFQSLLEQNGVPLAQPQPAVN